jgi:hypothetical protein
MRLTHPRFRLKTIKIMIMIMIMIWTRRGDEPAT